MTLKLKEVIKIHIAHAVTGVVFHIAIISSFNSQYANNMKTFKILLLLCAHVHCSEKNRLTNKEIYANLKKSLESIKNSCGEICDQTIKGKPGAFFDHIKKNVNCEALFTNPDIDASSDFPHSIHGFPMIFCFLTRLILSVFHVYKPGKFHRWCYEKINF